METKVLSRIIQSALNTQPVLAALECSSRQDTLDTRGDSAVRETAANLDSSLPSIDCHKQSSYLGHEISHVRVRVGFPLSSIMCGYFLFSR